MSLSIGNPTHASMQVAGHITLKFTPQGICMNNACRHNISQHMTLYGTDHKRGDYIQIDCFFRSCACQQRYYENPEKQPKLNF
jgi:hypothetical protein